MRRGAMILVSAVVWVAWGCSTTPDPQTQQYYEVALERMVSGHVYAMGCPALLPLAEQVLWDQGFSEIQQVDDHRGLRTGWVDADPRTQASYEVHAHPVGDQQCAVQFIRREEGATFIDQRRDVFGEFELLRYIDGAKAREIERQARRQANDLANAEEM